jgi:hypothetical protein
MAQAQGMVRKATVGALVCTRQRILGAELRDRARIESATRLVIKPKRRETDKRYQGDWS